VEWYSAAAVLIGLIIGMMALGVPVAVAFMATNMIGTLVFVGGVAGMMQVVDNSTALITTFQLVPVPLFILMGSLFFYSGLAVRVFDALDKLFGRLPGRLCYLTVAGGATFSTMTGSSMANTAMLGSLMVPEMQRRGYNWRMSLGPILGTGGLAMIIPPSNLGVLLASVASIDVGRLLIAGVIPGFLLAGLYGAMILLQVWIDPKGAPSYDVAPSTWWEKLYAVVVNILPMGIVVFMVALYVCLRYAFNWPIPGHVELVQLLTAFIIFFGLAAVQTSGGHVALDAVVRRFRGRSLLCRR